MHFLRDVHTLMKEFPHDQARLTWAKAIKAIYDDAVVWAAQEPDQRRPLDCPQDQRRLSLLQRISDAHGVSQPLWDLDGGGASILSTSASLC